MISSSLTGDESPPLALKRKAGVTGSKGVLLWMLPEAACADIYLSFLMAWAGSWLFLKLELLILVCWAIKFVLLRRVFYAVVRSMSASSSSLRVSLPMASLSSSRIRASSSCLFSFTMVLLLCCCSWRST